MKIDIKESLEKAIDSSRSLWKLNFIMGIGIPFNKPHGIKVHKVEPNAVVTIIPHKRKNYNHIGGVHACGLATAAEFCSGLMLLRNLNAKKYRLIMQKLEVEYFFQAKKDAFARFSLDEADIQQHIKTPLEKDGVVFYVCEIPVHDSDNNHLCTVKTNWQIKKWSMVKTKV